jgi:hypothetical protein
VVLCGRHPNPVVRDAIDSRALPELAKHSILGMPFPSGLRRLEAFHSPSVRWAWSLNAASSVLGSAGAIILAIYAGLRATLLLGAGLYVCALVVILATKRTQRGDL